MPEPLAPALAELRSLLLDERRLVRGIAAGRRRGGQVPWRRVELRPVDLRAGRRLQVVCCDEQQAHTTNIAYGEPATTAVDELLALPFANWHVETVDATVQLRVTKKGAAQVHRDGGTERAGGRVGRHAGDRTNERMNERTDVPTRPVCGSPAPHDRVKPRLVDPAEPFLVALGVTSRAGQVRAGRRDKYLQVEGFVRALDPVVRDALPGRSEPGGASPSDPLRVVDLGCGNAYLTFAAYRHLSDVQHRPVELVGVDVRAQAREHNAKIAADLGWSGSVRFVEGTILDAPVERADVVLALHACDTATDGALARAVRWQAPVVLAAPCCHHDLQRQLRAGRPPAPYGLLTRHGIVRERFADALTDALRAALLRLLGYRVEVLEFVDGAATPRNALLRAVRTGAPPTPALAEEYVALTGAWGVRPALERLLRAELAPVLDGVPGRVHGPVPAR